MPGRGHEFLRTAKCGHLASDALIELVVCLGFRQRVWYRHDAPINCCLYGRVCSINRRCFYKLPSVFTLLL
jgi:hypothetical protein